MRPMAQRTFSIFSKHSSQNKEKSSSTPPSPASSLSFPHPSIPTTHTHHTPSPLSSPLSPPPTTPITSPHTHTHTHYTCIQTSQPRKTNFLATSPQHHHQLPLVPLHASPRFAPRFASPRFARLCALRFALRASLRAPRFARFARFALLASLASRCSLRSHARTLQWRLTLESSRWITTLRKHVWTRQHSNRTTERLLESTRLGLGRLQCRLRGIPRTSTRFA